VPASLDVVLQNPNAVLSPKPTSASARPLADVATIGILQERAIRHGKIVTEQLQTALNSRVIIEQAKASSPSTGS
jgi:hypothetical protein